MFCRTGLLAAVLLLWPRAAFVQPELRYSGADVNLTDRIRTASLQVSQDSCGPADLDSDGIFDLCDNCPAMANPGQEDDDSDGYGNLCDPCSVELPGDCNGNGSVSMADLIAIVGTIFKGGQRVIPCYAGDINCSGAVSSADVIALLNFIYRSGPPPCDVCALVPAVWDDCK